jgi:hypothetical protein
MTSPAQRSERSLRWAAFFFLVCVLLGLGFFIVPSHWTSIWNDREFTDWISPIANRLHDGARLYEHGLHNPMPPLPFVLVRVLFPDGAVWLQENLLNYAFQAAMILVLFLAFVRQVRVATVFAAALGAIPVYLAFPKTILYDSMAQFFVVASALSAVSLIRKPASWSAGLGLALSMALLFLSKQSTAAGTLLGVLLSLLLFASESELRRRVRLASLVLLGTVVFISLIALLCAKYLSFPGMIRDVFLGAPEAKGGTLHMLGNLPVYALQVALIVATVFCVFYLLNAVLTGKRSTWKPASLLLEMSDAEAGTALQGESFLAMTAIAAFLLGFGGEFLIVAYGQALPSQFHDVAWGNLILNLGFVACLYFAIHPLLRRLKAAAEIPVHPLSIYALIFLLSAVGHNLSVHSWRWSHDNNPLVFLASVTVFSAVFGSNPAGESTTPPWRTAMLTAFALIAMWPLAGDQIRAIRDCRQPWPEVKQLAGARMRPEADGMRTLVQSVRSLVNPTNGETVLLLPNDPNVEAWFERDRPKLSSAILFTDQYLDRYVDADFAELRAHPPKVIVIGPLNAWRSFSRKWNHGRGAERLIDLVQTKLLPQGYEFHSRQIIAYQGGTDFMLIYVRRAP